MKQLKWFTEPNTASIPDGYYRCPRHTGMHMKKGDTCSWCESILRDYPIADMSINERIEELEMWAGENMCVLTVEWGAFHERLEALVGRGIWTHELVHPETIIQELKTKLGYYQQGDEQQILNDSLVILVEENPQLQIVGFDTENGNISECDPETSTLEVIDDQIDTSAFDNFINGLENN